MADRVDVRRVNVLASEGRHLAGRLEVDRVPMVLLFDRAGRKWYRESGLAVRREVLERRLAELEARAS